MAEHIKKLKLLSEFEEWVRLIEKIFELEKEAASKPRSYATYAATVEKGGAARMATESSVTTVDRPTQGDIYDLYESIMYNILIPELLVWIETQKQRWERIRDIKPRPEPVPELGVGAFPVDIEETDDVYIFEAELAGVEMDNIEIYYLDNILTISARREEPIQNRSDNLIRRERIGGKLTRSFHIKNIVEEKANASFENGVLRVVLPKRRVPKENRIPITKNTLQ